MVKVCNKCMASKAFEAFSKCSSNSDGLQRWCKECTKEYRKNNAEKIAEGQRKKYLKKREEWLEKNRISYRKNRERIIKQKAEYSKKNPEVKRRSSLKRRVSINKNKYQIIDKDMRKLYSSPCTYCGSLDNIQGDHVIPVSRGGYHGIGNLTPCCYKCNPSKGDRTIMEWRLSKLG